MLRYSVKRLLQSIVTIVIVVSIVFLLLRLMPDSGYFDTNTWDKASWSVKLTTLQKLGIYDANGERINPFVQLFHFYVKLFTTFDFGESTKIQQGIPVTQILSDKIPYSLAFGSVSTLIALVLGYTIGIFMAKYKGRIFDKAGMAYIIFFSAVPSIVYFFLLQHYITLWTGWPMIFKKGVMESWFTPVFIMSITGAAGTALWIRRFTVDQLNSDYVKLAYAKGLPGTKVMFSHVLRNAFVPMAYGLPAAFIMAIGGSVVIENLFSIPGMGGFLIKAFRERDNNIVQYIIFIYASLGIFSVFLGDLLATFVDPRIRLANKGGIR